jgi:hypothetical protein
LIEEFSKKRQSEVVLRLAALPADRLDAILMGRVINPSSIAETSAVLAENGTPFTADELVRDAFTPKEGYPTPFSRGRYGDGTTPIYYAALEEPTCVEEVKHHQGEALQPGKYFSMVSCRLDGLVLLLCGYENRYPDLTSTDQSGYPFCQKLAYEARSEDVDALHAPSARNKPSGTCIPVFREQVLSDRRVAYRGRFVQAPDGSLRFDKV